MIQREVLPNGVRIVTENISYVQSVALGIWVGVGARDESDKLRGVSHVIEHMLFKGTPSRTAQQIADEIDTVGGDINAFTSKENTCYHVRVLSEHVPLALDILTDMFLNSSFDAEELGREKNVILEEIKQRDDEPDDLVHDLFAEVTWPGHVLGKSVIGTPETVSSFNSDDLRSYIKNCYTPDTIVISAAGNLNHDEIVAYVASKFGDLTGSISDWRAADTTPEFQPGQIYVEKPIEQVNLVMGVPGVSQLSDEKYALSILDNVLGGSMSSRLFQEIREKRGLAYSVGTYAQSYQEGGYFAFYSGTGAATAEQVIDLIKAECVNIRKNGVTEKELQRSKNQFRGGIVMGQESMNSRMMRMGRNELNYGRVLPIQEIMDKINAVTVSDIASLSERLFAKEEFSMATVGPAPGSVTESDEDEEETEE
ncbi:peptidase M16 [Capsulimonas corticalis]|uniref:Peptidase M16 n=1 Tax=Capsulimonas corticalis TaxID=2219043 RepID=A0A402CXN8_9BACT|nr:pitrilysin family protein [Capsulimonas corticalis]BDI32265.1 peptidase M16 [Capsulimonas corticalis]